MRPGRRPIIAVVADVATEVAAEAVEADAAAEVVAAEAADEDGGTGSPFHPHL